MQARRQTRRSLYPPSFTKAPTAAAATSPSSSPAATATAARQPQPPSPQALRLPPTAPRKSGEAEPQHLAGSRYAMDKSPSPPPASRPPQNTSADDATFILDVASPPPPSSLPLPEPSNCTSLPPPVNRRSPRRTSTRDARVSTSAGFNGVLESHGSPYPILMPEEQERATEGLRRATAENEATTSTTTTGVPEQGKQRKAGVAATQRSDGDRYARAPPPPPLSQQQLKKDRLPFHRRVSLVRGAGELKSGGSNSSDSATGMSSTAQTATDENLVEPSKAEQVNLPRSGARKMSTMRDSTPPHVVSGSSNAASRVAAAPTPLVPSLDTTYAEYNISVGGGSGSRPVGQTKIVLSSRQTLQRQQPPQPPTSPVALPKLFPEFLMSFSDILDEKDDGGARASSTPFRAAAATGVVARHGSGSRVPNSSNRSLCSESPKWRPQDFVGAYLIASSNGTQASSVYSDDAVEALLHPGLSSGGGRRSVVSSQVTFSGYFGDCQSLLDNQSRPNSAVLHLAAEVDASTGNADCTIVSRTGWYTDMGNWSPVTADEPSTDGKGVGATPLGSWTARWSKCSGASNSVSSSLSSDSNIISNDCSFSGLSPSIIAEKPENAPLLALPVIEAVDSSMSNAPFARVATIPNEDLDDGDAFNISVSSVISTTSVGATLQRQPSCPTAVQRRPRLLPLAFFRRYYTAEVLLGKDSSSCTYRVRERHRRRRFAATFFMKLPDGDGAMPRPAMTAELQRRCAVALLLDHPATIKTADVFYGNTDDAVAIQGLVRSCTAANGKEEEFWVPDVVRPEDMPRGPPSVSIMGSMVMTDERGPGEKRGGGRSPLLGGAAHPLIASAAPAAVRNPSGRDPRGTRPVDAPVSGGSIMATKGDSPSGRVDTAVMAVPLRAQEEVAAREVGMQKPSKTPSANLTVAGREAKRIHDAPTAESSPPEPRSGRLAQGRRMILGNNKPQESPVAPTSLGKKSKSSKAPASVVGQQGQGSRHYGAPQDDLEELALLLSGNSIVAVLISELIDIDTRFGHLPLVKLAETSGGLPVPFVSMVLRGVLEALHYLHEYRAPSLAIIHGSLDALDIAIDKAGRVWMMSYQLMHWRMAPTPPPLSTLTVSPSSSTPVEETEEETSRRAARRTARLSRPRGKCPQSNTPGATGDTPTGRSYDDRDAEAARRLLLHEKAEDMKGFGHLMWTLLTGQPASAAKQMLTSRRNPVRDTDAAALLKGLLEEDESLRLTSGVALAHPFLEKGTAAQ